MHLITFSSSLVEHYFFDGLNSSSAAYFCRRSLHKFRMMKTDGYVFLFMHLVLCLLQTPTSIIWRAAVINLGSISHVMDHISLSRCHHICTNPSISGQMWGCTFTQHAAYRHHICLFANSAL
uniref:Bm143 n=1 Tax=Brugia malayi TaxID=6279 RepID=A0A1I9FZW9_BRUMA|nr:Bm143 [Brugia malayi]